MRAQNLLSSFDLQVAFVCKWIEEEAASAAKKGQFSTEYCLQGIFSPHVVHIFNYRVSQNPVDELDRDALDDKDANGPYFTAEEIASRISKVMHWCSDKQM